MERTSDADGWKQQERDGFGHFLTRKRSILLELLIIDSVSQSPTEILGSGCQCLVEREDGVMEVLVCCGGAERERERERDEHFDFAKKEKSKRGWVFEFFRVIFVFLI